MDKATGTETQANNLNSGSEENCGGSTCKLGEGNERGLKGPDRTGSVDIRYGTNPANMAHSPVLQTNPTAARGDSAVRQAESEKPDAASTTAEPPGPRIDQATLTNKSLLYHGLYNVEGPGGGW